MDRSCVIQKLKFMFMFHIYTILSIRLPFKSQSAKAILEKPWIAESHTKYAMSVGYLYHLCPVLVSELMKKWIESRVN